MNTRLEDGTGNGFIAEVTPDKQLSTLSVSVPYISYESERHGDAFLFATRATALTTTASFNAIAFLKNTNSQSLYIESLRVCGGICAAASTMQVDILRNPTAGTIISDASAGLQLPSNTGSTEQFDGLFYKATGDAKTFTDGDDWTFFQGHAPGHSTQEYKGSLILNRNGSMGILIKPSVAMEVCIEIVAYYK